MTPRFTVFVPNSAPNRPDPSVGGDDSLSEWVPRLQQNLPKVRRALQQVRRDLASVGLLAKNVYLDAVELHIVCRINKDDAGFVFDEGIGPFEKRMGFKPGAIYLPINLPHISYMPGYTLADTIRHEFAHAWHWIEPTFFRRPWFRETFGAAYTNNDPMPLQAWKRQKKQDVGFARKLRHCETAQEKASIKRAHLLDDFVTEYASTMSREDFAETFMYYLKYRNSLERFRCRPGAYNKLKAVEAAVSTARKELRL